MGLPIGQAPATLNAIAGARNIKPVSLLSESDRPPLRLLGRRDSSNSNALFNRTKRDSAQPGLRSQPGLRPQFGSAPAAALNVVIRTVSESKNLIPTISELQKESRQRALDRRTQLRETFVAQNLENLGNRRTKETSDFARTRTNRIERRLPDPSAQARNFINSLNDTAAFLQARFADEPPPRRSGPSIRINGQDFPIRSRTSGVRLNISV